MPPQIDTSTKREYRTTIFHIFLKTKKKKKKMNKKKKEIEKGWPRSPPLGWGWAKSRGG
jgi:hypothetical protein